MAKGLEGGESARETLKESGDGSVDFPVVGIGASAGGLKPLEAFFGALPDQPRMAFFVVQHLAPDYESSLPNILARCTPLEVVEAADGMAVQPRRVYVIPPNSELSFEGGQMRVRTLQKQPARETIDIMLRSLAEVFGASAVGVILSGTGKDGSLGLRAVKEAEGMTMVQEPAQAEYEGMPRSAIATGVVDLVGPVGELAERLVAMSDGAWPPERIESFMEGDEQRAFEHVLRAIREASGIDFGEYKRATMWRRIGRRIQVLGSSGIREYADYLNDHPEEVEALENELLILVTRFFRDPEVWEAVEATVVPELFEEKTAGDQVRVWVPGCATGEEAYTVGMLLMEYAETMASPPEIKVFGTDIHEEGIEAARAGTYPIAIAEDISEERLERFFFVEDGQYKVSQGLRDRILFSVQNVMRDPPFSNLDMISCRNLLIYLDAAAQERLLQSFHYGLKPDGVLVLGQSETPNSADGLFKGIDPSHRIYQARAGVESKLPRPRVEWRPDDLLGANREAQGLRRLPDVEAIHRRSALVRHVPPSVLVNDNWEIEHIIGEVGDVVQVREGKASRHLLDMVDVELRPKLRRMLRAIFEGAERREAARIRRRGGRELDVEVVRVEGGESEEIFADVTFEAREEASEESGEVGRESGSGEEVARLEEELEQLRGRLRRTIEEYESSSEELLSMNEELQSTTEELESSKEELQSMNEELTTLNDELNAKVEELNEVNSDLKNLLASTEIGTVFLDRKLRVRRFSEPVQEYINILEVDVGRPFRHLTHDLGGEDLEEDAREVLRTETMLERETATGEGRHFLVRLYPYRTVDGEVDGVVLTFIDITKRKQVEERLKESEEKFRTVVKNAAEAIFVYHLDEQGRPQPFMEVNERATEMLGTSREALLEQAIDEVFDVSLITEHLEEVRETQGASREATVDVEGREMPVEIRSSLFELGDHPTVVDVVRDMTAQKRYEEALRQAKDKAEELAELRSMFLSTLSHEVRSPLMGITSNVHLMKGRIGEGSELWPYVHRVERSAEKLKNTLDSVLKLTRLEAGEWVPERTSFDLVEALEDEVDLYATRAEQAGLELRAKLPEEPCEVELDPQFLEQILNNLLDNALKYTEQGHIEVGLEAGGERVRIRISDTGRGIAEEQQAAIFDQFAQLEGENGGKTGEGVGLGLAITNRLVEAMGGAIELESGVGEGTTFVVDLPRELGASGG